MKKITLNTSLALGLTLLSSLSFAQKQVETDAAVAYQAFEKAQMMQKMDDAKSALLRAKKSIDAASSNPETEKSPKTLFFKGEIYSSLAFMKMLGDAEFNKNIPDDAIQIGVDAYKASYSGSTKYKTDIENSVNTIKQLMHPLGQAAYEAKKFKEAGEAFGVINKYNSILGTVDTVYIYYQGMAAESDTNWVKAAEYYKTCAEMGYQPDATYRATAMAYIKAGQNDKAVDFLKQAIAKSPKDKHLYFALGTIAMDMKDDQTVLTNLNKAVEIDPTYSDAFYNLGSYFSSKGLELRQKADALPPSAKKEADEMFAKSLEFYGYALDPLEKYIAIQPKDVDVLNSLVKICRATKNTEKATKYMAMLEEAKK
jgi:tetratricopeptide (TPR) repeat protein